ncbi:conserved protein of unknown function; putative YcgN protein, partial [uncultured Gammaproteobacteria bacterium]
MRIRQKYRLVDLQVHKSDMKDKFWQELSLSEMTRAQWESLCDGCGRCCLHKIEDEDTNEIYFTDVACRYLDEETCQ